MPGRRTSLPGVDHPGTGGRGDRGTQCEPASAPSHDRRRLVIEEHFTALCGALERTTSAAPQIREWGRHLAGVLTRGGRLLTCGNGGSAAEAQHLSGELVGRFVHDRQPLSAI